MKQCVILLCFWAVLSYGSDCAFNFLSDVTTIPDYGASIPGEKQRSFQKFLEQIKKIKEEPVLAGIKSELDELVLADRNESIERVIFFEFWNKFQIRYFFEIFAGYQFKSEWKDSFWKAIDSGQIFYWRIENISVVILEDIYTKKLYFYMGSSAR